MPNYLEELGKRGLSLRKFAQRIGMSVEWVGKIMRGEVETTAETEQKIREELSHCPWCGNKWPHPLPKGTKKS